MARRRKELIRKLRVAAILFDMDGVLLDSRPVVERTWRRWASRHGLSAEAILRVAHGRRTRDTLREVVPALATESEVAWLDAAELEDLDVRPVPGAASLVASLPPSRWTVVTSAGLELARLRMEAVGLGLPASAVTSEAIASGKPAPEGFLLAARRLGVSPLECLVIEDTPPGHRSRKGGWSEGDRRKHDPPAKRASGSGCCSQRSPASPGFAWRERPHRTVRPVIPTPELRHRSFHRAVAGSASVSRW